MQVKQYLDLAKQAFNEWKEDKASRLAASLAYYTIFSLAPLLLIVIVVVGAIWGEEAARGQIFGQLEDIAGQETAEAVQNLISNIGESQSGGLAAVIGVIGLVVGATSVFSQLQDALNTIWEVQTRPGRGIKGMLRDRATTFLLLGGVGVLLLLSLVLDTVVNGLTGYLNDLLPGVAYVTLLRVVNVAVWLALVTLAFAMIFKILPDVKIAWEDVWIGAFVTAVLFTLGRYAISLYIARSGTASAYGAAGSLIIILLWIYYSAQIFFMGAEFTQVYAQRHGKEIAPADNAIKLRPIDRAQRGIVRDETLQADIAPQPSKPESGPVETPAASHNRLTNVAVAAVLAFVAGAVAGFFGDKGSA